ncbi:MAG: nucleotidyltransferase domain-containing protein [Nitrososphaerota archaeon]|nr:nucleotidyltransferase domain-containing protein [Nitrososphaerales archaeon]MDW8045094.1 nucleotidyltransferase domain-containing protein [Nitrososphaerota archaeon]
MWIPSWLGECYSKLYLKFKLNLFTFNEAKEFLSWDDNKLSVAFSKLHSKRFLLIFSRKKPRLYRLLDPNNMIFLASGSVKNFDKIILESHLKLILDCLREVLNVIDLESFAVYGSVARGTASNISDVDILLISDSFRGSLALRIEELCKVEYLMRDELKWLRDRNIYTSLSFYPLRKDEAERLPLLFLDMVEDSVILYDKDRFLEGLLLNLHAKLLKVGAKRLFINRDRWYWDLKPDYKLGEVVEVI